MKRLLILLTILLTLSCNDDRVSYSCTKGTIRVLNKNGEFYRDRFYAKMYLYDGTKAYWCDTDERTFKSYEINDTLPTLVIIKTYEKTN